MAMQKEGRREREKESQRKVKSLESKKGESQRERGKNLEREEGPNSPSYTGHVILLLLSNCGAESNQKARSLGHCLSDLYSHASPVEAVGAVPLTGGRGPGDMIDYLLSHVCGNHHPSRHQVSRPLLNLISGCLCTYHHPTPAHLTSSSISFISNKLFQVLVSCQVTFHQSLTMSTRILWLHNQYLRLSTYKAKRLMIDFFFNLGLVTRCYMMAMQLERIKVEVVGLPLFHQPLTHI